MNILDSVKHYDNSWTVVKEEQFSEEEAALITSATVVSGDYGLAVKMTTEAFCCYFALSARQNFPIGTELDPRNCVIQTLVRMGDMCQKLFYKG